MLSLLEDSESHTPQLVCQGSGYSRKWEIGKLTQELLAPGSATLAAI